MKKLLLGTSALIGATAIVASASAAPELTISGNLDFRLVGGERPVNNARSISGNGDLGSAGTIFDIQGKQREVGAADNNYDFTRANSRSEIRFHAEGEANGNTYGARIDYRYFQEGGQKTDEAYIFISGDWGTVHLGDDDGVIDARVPNAGSIAPGAYLIDDTTTFINMETNGGNGDDTKVSYFSRNVNGFQFGISVYESVGSTDGTVPDPANDIEGTIGYEDVYEVAVSYDFDLFGDSHTIGLGYQGGGAITQGNNQAHHEDLAEYVVGFKLNFGDVSLAGSYNDAGDSGIALNDTRQEARTFYSLGVAYDLGGGMAVGLSYGKAETKGPNVAANATPEDREETLTTVDFGFPIMDGMAGYAGIARSELEITGQMTTAGANSVEATTFLVGTTVSF